MTIQNLIQNNLIEPVNTTAVDARLIFNKATKVLKFATKNLSSTGDEDIIYAQIYDALRLACSALLVLSGCRVKTSSTGYYRTTIEAAAFIIAGEFENEFFRIQKMRKNRNIFEYGNSIDISATELKQAMADAKTLITKIDGLISAKESKLPI